MCVYAIQPAIFLKVVQHWRSSAFVIVVAIAAAAGVPVVGAKAMCIRFCLLRISQSLFHLLLTILNSNRTHFKCIYLFSSFSCYKANLKDLRSYFFYTFCVL